MGDPRGENYRVGREQSVREGLFTALVPGDGGSKCVCLLIGRGASVGELPLQGPRPSVAKAETRRSNRHCACAVVGVRHVVGTGCARRGRIFLRRLLIGFGSLGTTQPLRAWVSLWWT
jgi:hypothetical protein